MSSNPFAALDDSGDEGPAKVAAAPKGKKTTAPKVAPVSKPDPKSKPKNNDRNTKSGRGRGGPPPARDGKRTYDRRSGTGRGKEIKKGGGGARNWGNDKDEAKKAEGRINENAEVAPATDGNESPDVPAEEIEPEKEDNTISYADYIAAKGKKEEVALRDVQNDFAGIAVSEKKVEESFVELGGGKKKKDKKKKETEKKIIEVGFRAPKVIRDDDRGERRDGGRGRGAGRGERRDGRGRGAGRGGKSGRGAGRGPKPSSSKKPQGLNVQDEGAFPSL